MGTIRNLSNTRSVSIRLNTGQTRHIPPGGSLSGILDVEVNGNAMVQKLKNRHVIALRGFKRGRVSTKMNADQAVAHIQDTPLAELQGFVQDDEKRKSVRRAWEAKQNQ